MQTEQLNGRSTHEATSHDANLNQPEAERETASYQSLLEQLHQISDAAGKIIGGARGRTYNNIGESQRPMSREELETTISDLQQLAKMVDEITATPFTATLSDLRMNHSGEYPGQFLLTNIKNEVTILQEYSRNSRRAKPAK